MRRFYRDLATIRSLRFCALAIAYGAAMAGTMSLAYLLRFDFQVPAEFRRGVLPTIAWIVGLKIAVLLCFGQFKDSLTYFSTPDLKRVVGVCGISALLLLLTFYFGGLAVAPPRGIIVMDCVLACGALCGGRVSLRFLRESYLAPQTRELKRAKRV